MKKGIVLDDIIERIHDLNIVGVLSRHMQLIQKGPHAHGLCPFHRDNRVGSFVVTPSKGMFKCFACGEGGDAIYFVSKFTNVHFVQAAFDIALSEGIITQDEYDSRHFKSYSKKEVTKVTQAFNGAHKLEKKVLPSPSTLHAYYSVFLSVMTYGKEGEVRLHEEDLRYLKEERKLTEFEILDRGYCTLLRPTSLRLNKLVEELREKCLRPEVLRSIPGFYEQKKGDKWFMTYAFNEGVVIPIKNADGHIVALQVRRREKDEFKGRYFWFSSGFAEYHENMRNGTSPGAPLDVLYPEGRPSQALFITEGRFKSEAISKNFKSTSISVQGVGNWKGIMAEIEKIQTITSDNYPEFKGYKYLYLAFDSDMKYKYQVYQQLKKMTDAIQEKIPGLIIKYLYWNTPEKGIDDLLLQEKYEIKETVMKYDKSMWDKSYIESVEKIMKKSNLSSAFELSPEDLKNVKIEKRA